MRTVPLAVSLIALLACGSASAPQDGVGGVSADRALSGDVASSGLVVTDATAADLVYLREEEKLARDVYLTLGARWSLKVFAQISESEQRHMDSVLSLLEQAGLPDPAEGKGIGEFTNGEIAALYAALVAQGLSGETDALVVGATIEDLDLSDLLRMAGETDVATVLTVYGHLTDGSENHLRAFVGLLTERGVTYEPQFIDQATYDAILAEGTSPRA